VRIRRTAYFSGHVQGVGFRYTACRVAARFPVTGYVRNLRDGRVELVAEGEAEQVQAFLEAVRNAMGGYIHEVTTVDAPAEGQFRDFSIRF